MHISHDSLCKIIRVVNDQFPVIQLIDVPEVMSSPQHQISFGISVNAGALIKVLSLAGCGDDGGEFSSESLQASRADDEW